MRKRCLFLTVLLCSSGALFSQSIPSLPSKWIDSIRLLLSDTALRSVLVKVRPDSSIARQFTNKLRADTAQLRHQAAFQPNQKIPFPHGPLLQFTGGQVSYDWNYRSQIDTPFQEHGIVQNLITARMGFNVAAFYPVTVTYFERESNSQYFRDYRDVRVEFNAAEFNRMRANRLNAYATQLSRNLRDPSLKPALDVANSQVDQLSEWLQQGKTVKKLIDARAVVLNNGPPTAGNSDSLLRDARAFLALYDRFTAYEARLRRYRDSLQNDFIANEKKVLAVRKIMNSRLSPDEEKNALQDLTRQYGIDNGQLNKIYGRLGGIRSLAAGKVLPNYSDLTLKNVNVNGVSFEYSKGIYLAMTAGAVDYRARDFFYTRRLGKPQMVYTGRIGYGTREGAHAFFTAFKGKKQLLNSGASQQVLDIYGLAFETQLLLTRHIRFLGEAAQSAAPSLVNAVGPSSKPRFRLNDEKNKAYSLSLFAILPKTLTRIDGYYRYRGIDFQSFTSYYVNAAATSWQVRGDQYFWKKTLHLNASVSRNNYDNSYLPVRYSGNTVTENLSLTFRRNHWPTLTVGLMPSSQLSQVDGQVYQNYYQSLNISASHVYQVGLARAVSVVSYNRFYNDAKDAGFIYYNARNFFLTQNLQFLSYAANIGISRSVSRDYRLTVMDAGATATVWKHSSIGFGVKINQLNDKALKLGLYGSERISLPRIGELTAWIEKAYLPGWNDVLTKNEFYHLSFTRFFKP